MTVEPEYVPDHGHVIMTRHALVRYPELSGWSDDNPTTGQPHVPLVARLSRPSASVRLFFIQHTNDGWVNVYWITSALTYALDVDANADGEVEVDYDPEEEMNDAT